MADPDLCRITPFGQVGRYELANLSRFADSPWQSVLAVKGLQNAPTLRRLAGRYFHHAAWMADVSYYSVRTANPTKYR